MPTPFWQSDALQQLAAQKAARQQQQPQPAQTPGLLDQAIKVPAIHAVTGPIADFIMRRTGTASEAPKKEEEFAEIQKTLE